MSNRHKSKQTQNYYNEWTKHYLQSGYGDVIQAHRPADVKQLLDYIIAQSGMKSGMKILDAGCGVCGPAIYFAQQLDIEIDAISISDEQIRIAKDKIQQNRLEKLIHTHVSDYHNMDKHFQAESFDLIIFLESFGHSTTPNKVLNAAVSLLKPGGKLYIKDYFQKEITGNKTRKTAIRRIIKNMNTAYAYNLPDLNHTIQTLRQSDMELIRINRNELPLDNDKSVLEFEKEHGIDLFEGGFHYRFLDALELLFSKPHDVDEPIA